MKLQIFRLKPQAPDDTRWHRTLSQMKKIGPSECPFLITQPRVKLITSMFATLMLTENPKRASDLVNQSNQ